MVQKVSLKEEIKKQLEEHGTVTLNEGTLQNMAAVAAASQAPMAQARQEIPEEDKDSKVTVGSEALDPLLQAGNQASTEQAINDRLLESESPIDPFGLIDDEKEVVTITVADKTRFQNCFVEGTRFERPFELLGGKVTGVFRCRKEKESRAILNEMIRSAREMKLDAGDYAARLRHALMHCQVAELNGKVREEWKEPLRAVEAVNLETKTMVTKPPVWSQEMEIIFDNMTDAVTNALYCELKRFEKVYWTMVKEAPNQNFWLPGDSTTE